MILCLRQKNSNISFVKSFRLSLSGPSKKIVYLDSRSLNGRKHKITQSLNEKKNSQL